MPSSVIPREHGTSSWAMARASLGSNSTLDLPDVDPMQGPLWSFGFGHSDDGKTIIAVRSHTAAADAWSMPLAVADLIARYDGGSSEANAGLTSFVAEHRLLEAEESQNGDVTLCFLDRGVEQSTCRVDISPTRTRARAGEPWAQCRQPIE